VDARRHARDRPRGGEWAREATERGAGEILLTSIDRDGTMQGYDVELVRHVATVVNVPVIASGGAGKCLDFVDALTKGHAGPSRRRASFTSPTRARSRRRPTCGAPGIPVR